MLNYNILHSLKLLNGVDCYVFTNPNTNDKNDNDDNDDNNDDNDDKDSSQTQIIIPITRCELVGIIVNITNRSNGAIMYLLDDGTGFMDCLTWRNDDPNDPYHLPQQHHHSTNANIIHLGDLVRVRGKIKCLGRYHSDLDMDQNQMVREIHIFTIEKMSQSMDWDCESVHWMKCIQFQTRVCHSEMDNKHILTGANVLQFLGTNMESFIQNYNNDSWYESNYTVTDDKQTKTNKSTCNCHCPHKEQLLYCHCIATKIDLDPNFIFRDALLSHLLTSEQNTNNIDINARYNHPFYKNSSLKHIKPLFFQYKTILSNSHLLEIAMRIVTTSDIPHDNKEQQSISTFTKKCKDTNQQTNHIQTSALRRSLYMNTFRALRKDGILSLLDVDKDEYILLTRHTVLLPLLKIFMNNHKSKYEQQGDYMDSIATKKPMAQVKHLLSQYEFLNNVPIAKMQFLQKELNEPQSSLD